MSEPKTTIPLEYDSRLSGKQVKDPWPRSWTLSLLLASSCYLAYQLSVTRSDMWWMYAVFLGFCVYVIAVACIDMLNPPFAEVLYENRKSMAEFLTRTSSESSLPEPRIGSRFFRTAGRQLQSLGFVALDKPSRLHDVCDLRGWKLCDRYYRHQDGRTVAQLRYMRYTELLSLAAPWLRGFPRITFLTPLSNGEHVVTVGGPRNLIAPLPPSALQEVLPFKTGFSKLFERHLKRVAEVLGSAHSAQPSNATSKDPVTLKLVRTTEELIETQEAFNHEYVRWLQETGFVSTNELAERIRRVDKRRRAREWARLRELRAADGYETAIPVESVPQPRIA